jgi:hypothetical protein
MIRDVRPWEQDLRSLGFTEAVPGGDVALESMARLAGGVVVEAAPEPKPVTEGADPSKPAPVEGQDDPFEGPVLSEELLERMEALDLGSADLDTLDELLAAIGDKQVPEALEERLTKVLDEMKKVRIEAGKVTRVNVRRGSKAMRDRRKRRMEYKRNKASIKIQRKKRSRTAGAKIKAGKTERKHKSMSGALKKVARVSSKKLGGLNKKAKGKSTGLVRGESKLARALDALLAESRTTDATIRDEIVGRLGDCLVLIDWIIDEEEIAERFVEAYEPLVDAYAAGSLVEAKLDDAAFQAQIAPVVRMIGKCVDELQGNLEGLA